MDAYMALNVIIADLPIPSSLANLFIVHKVGFGVMQCAFESSTMDKEVEMKTVVLNVNDQVVDKLMWFLGHFNKDEINILDESFLASKAYLQHELEDMEHGATMMDEKTFWQSTENALSQ